MTEFLLAKPKSFGLIELESELVTELQASLGLYRIVSMTENLISLVVRNSKFQKPYSTVFTLFKAQIFCHNSLFTGQVVQEQRSIDGPLALKFNESFSVTNATHV